MIYYFITKGFNLEIITTKYVCQLLLFKYNPTFKLAFLASDARLRVASVGQPVSPRIFVLVTRFCRNSKIRI